MKSDRVLRVLVHEEGQEEPKVEVTVPLKLAKWALKLAPFVEGKIKAQTDLDFEALRQLLDEGFNELEDLEDFDLVKVNDGKTRVRVSIGVK